MTDPRSQSTYQVRLGWGERGLDELAPAGVVIVVDVLGSADPLAARAIAMGHGPTVLIGTLRNATATAQAAYDEQLARGGRTAIALVLAGDDGAFAVEDYLAAGAIGDALTARGIDHSAPDVAVATEGFRALGRAVKHLVSASASGLALAAEGRRDEVRAAAEVDADAESTLVVGPGA
ncbi:2-phosphosulfolactate phosphatase [Microbacterium sp. ZXX196]|uniref:2-phosphosulfolactate phosphatase n=1 Tax=Microbacterium sp. ZXX196 TaxID=2609291 RepID=UPI0012B90E6A|nr:2-phosphosulfolactate phosphatase [Microbacterium sp. ZXX196]MTE23562.1 phosphosulfolactate phosphohydrolase [Microbacterium sp. ZXX196]